MHSVCFYFIHKGSRVKKILLIWLLSFKYVLVVYDLICFLYFRFTYLFLPFPSWEDDPEGCLLICFTLNFYNAFNQVMTFLSMEHI